MGILGVVLGVFLMFSAAVAWIGGDREKASLEDTIKESQQAQAAMSAEADRAKNEAYKQDERIKELQGRLGESLIENNKLERAPAPEERDKREAAGENKPANALRDSRAEDPSADEVGSAKDQSSQQDERLKEPRGIERTLIGMSKPEQALPPEEEDKSAEPGNKTKGGLWETLTADADGSDEDNGNGAEDPRLKAAEGSLRRESSARAEAEKKLVIEARALSYLETELNETLMEVRQDWRGMPVAGAAFCPWDPGKAVKLVFLYPRPSPAR